MSDLDALKETIRRQQMEIAGLQQEITDRKSVV